MRPKTPNGKTETHGTTQSRQNIIHERLDATGVRVLPQGVAGGCTKEVVAALPPREHWEQLGPTRAGVTFGPAICPTREASNEAGSWAGNHGSSGSFKYEFRRY